MSLNERSYSGVREASLSHPPQGGFFCPEFRGIWRDCSSRYGIPGIRLGHHLLGARRGFSVVSDSGHARWFYSSLL